MAPKAKSKSGRKRRSTAYKIVMQLNRRGRATKVTVNGTQVHPRKPGPPPAYVTKCRNVSGPNCKKRVYDGTTVVSEFTVSGVCPSGCPGF